MHKKSKILLRGLMKALLVLFSTIAPLHADRWLVLPPRVEQLKPATNANLPGDLARAMALYLKLSRISQVVPVAEAEGCLKTAGVSMAQKINPDSLPAVAENCHAERMLLTRVRERGDDFEITTKVFFRESRQLSDTLVTSGSALLPVLGAHLSERFGKSPAAVKEESTDLLVAGDTFGGAYFDWQYARSLLLSLDYFKSGYCLVDQRGKLQSIKPRSDRGELKQFIDKLRFEGSGALSELDSIVDCAMKSAAASRAEGRRVLMLLLVSDFPRDPRSQVTARAQLRKLARAGKLVISPAGTASEATLRFWGNVARELAENAVFVPAAQHVRAGLSTGQEWHIFRRGGRLYESRDAEPARLEGGIRIPDKFADNTAPHDLLNIYQQMSGNKVISSSAPDVFAQPLKSALMAAFKSGSGDAATWRVLLDQNGQNFYVSLSPTDARRLAPGGFARIFTELKAPTEKELLRNRAMPTLLIDAAHESSGMIELPVAEYLKSPDKYLRKSLAARSFYILSGRVLKVIPPEADALDSGF